MRIPSGAGTTPVSDLAAGYLFMDISSIFVPPFQITHAVLDIQDTNQPSISLVWYLGRENGFESHVESNGFLYHSKVLGLIYTIYYALNLVEALLPVEPASLIEVHWRKLILWLLVIGFNPYNFYVFLYVAPAYCDVSICPYLGYQIRDYVQILIIIWFFCYALILYLVFYMCAVYYFYFQVGCFYLLFFA